MTDICGTMTLTLGMISVWRADMDITVYAGNKESTEATVSMFKSFGKKPKIVDTASTSKDSSPELTHKEPRVIISSGGRVLESWVGFRPSLIRYWSKQ